MTRTPKASSTGEAVSSLRAIAHPVRLQMLSLLTGAELSAAEVARELGLTHANASYHLRVLADAGEIVVAGEERIRGGVAKRYRHPWREVARSDRRPGRRPTPEEQELYLRALAEELVRRHRQRAPRAKQLMTDAEMWVPREAWTEVVDLVARASEIVHSQARPPRSEGTVHVNLTAAVFEMGDPS